MSRAGGGDFSASDASPSLFVELIVKRSPLQNSSPLVADRCEQLLKVSYCLVLLNWYDTSLVCVFIL